MERNEASDPAALYRRLSTCDTVWRVATTADSPEPGDPRWWTGAGLAGDRGFAAAFHQTERDVTARTGCPPRAYVTSTLLLMDYSWCVAAALVGPVLLADRLVDPVPGGVAARFAADETVLPYWRIQVTPAASRPADRRHPGTLSAVRSRYAELIRPVVEAAARHGSRRIDGLWRTATDTIATACWAIGGQLGDEQAGVDLAERLLADPVRPLRGRAGFRRLPLTGGGDVTTRERGYCCFYYTLDHPVCVTCPRIDDTARAARLSERQVAAPG